jgi:GNAT superfamily N-acetyltransferase
VRIDGVLAELSTPSGPVLLRKAGRADVPAVVELFAEDELSTGNDGIDDVGLQPYLDAFDMLDADPAHLLVVAEAAGRVVGTLQLSVLPGLARRGALRAQLEGVHVRSGSRGSGLGAAMVRWAVAESRRRGCALVQLTSQKRRTDAHRFYLRLGFTDSHEGFKLTL